MIKSIVLQRLAAAMMLGLSSTCSAHPVADVAQGQRLFLRCASCHAVSVVASGRIGPNLQSVFGRRAGSLPGYTYSSAMKAQRFSWDEAKLDAWLARPSAVVPGTTMAFAGMSNPNDRRAMIAYLRSLSKN